MNYAQLLFPDFALILTGYLLCRFTALDRQVWTQIDKLVYYFLFPVLMFTSIVKTTIRFDAVASFVPAGFLLAILTIALSYALPHVPLLKAQFSDRDHAGSAQIAFRFNSFIGLALVERIAGAPGLLLMAVLLGMCVPLFNVAAVWPMARHSDLNFLREMLRNPLIISTVSGLLANFSGFAFPDWLAPTVHRIGTASLPLGLMAAGAGMQVASLVRGKALAVSVLSIRHFIAPLLAFGIAYAMGLTVTQSTVLLIFSALPTAASSYVLAARMGYDGAYVSGLVTLSTLLGMFSLPFALHLLTLLR
ncbi:MAG TPA: AEC family transporter [Burkholderiaceae bacterium]|nr:AEC family transporter [Burkholderiaceae bacterium]